MRFEMVANNIGYEEFSKVLSYNPDTGDLWWKEFKGCKHKGKKAGTLTPAKYRNKPKIEVRYNNRAYLAHRIAWVIANKMEIPEGLVIDHINGNSCDNRISNLRAVTPTINTQNIRFANRRNASGLLGAFWRKREKTWMSSIGVNGEKRHLGTFKTKEEAHAAYIEAKRRLHEGCTI